MANFHALPTATDATLVAALRRGQDDAFDAIVMRHRTALLSHARRILRSPEDAEEVVQESLVRAHAALLAGDGTMSLSAWLHRIVHNASLDRLRRARPQVDLEVVGSLLHDRSADPHEKLERRELLNGIVAGVRALPERQRTALVLHGLEGRSHETVGHALGVSEGASKTLVCRARAGLRRQVAA
jgi:RNA polymerase sigma-70 factor, ECF subfamily